MTLSSFNVRSILRELANNFCFGNARAFENILLVGVQHILDTTVDMLSVMKEHGLKDAIIGGKTYSTNPLSVKKIEELGFTYVGGEGQLGYGRFDDSMQEIVHKVWFYARKKIEEKNFRLAIVLDDGADLLRATPATLFNGPGAASSKNKPNFIIGIEQTRGGTNHPLFSGLPFPVIDVAGSFAKNKIEYPNVAKLVLNKMTTLLKNNISIESPPVVGILGYGAMGKAIARCFVKKDFPVIVNDRNNLEKDDFKNILHYDNSSVLIANAGIVVGCTGEDITAKQENLSALLCSGQGKLLISTSSKDREFNTLLRIIQNETGGIGYVPNPLQTIYYKNLTGATITIARGGFPVNFTNEAHSVMPEHIWPTRAALMLACLSAAYMKKSDLDQYVVQRINTIKLPANIQTLILQKYCMLNPSEKELLQLCKLPQNELANLIIEYSGGKTINMVSDTMTEII